MIRGEEAAGKTGNAPESTRGSSADMAALPFFYVIDMTCGATGAPL